MDPLSDVLNLAHVRGALLARVRARAPWGIAIGSSQNAAFHAVLEGSCWLRWDGEPPRHLVAGDVLLFPTGAAHEIVSHPSARSVRLDRISKQQMLAPGGELNVSGSGAATLFACAAYTYDHEFTHPLFGLLPTLVHIHCDPLGATTGTQLLVRLLVDELGHGPGSQAATDRVLDVMLVYLIRAWMVDSAHDDASWLHALREPPIARALGLLHAHPQEAWTVESLAAAVAVSRATLARNFARLVGEPPLTYLTRWRMELAARRLRASDTSVAGVAASVGYASEFSSHVRSDAPAGCRPAGTAPCTSP